VPLSGLPAPLFPLEQKQEYLSRVVDHINDRYGVDTVHFAVQDTPGSRAPDRISFNALFDIEHE
jgi:hypothetical protein